ncbi:MAG: hypothetical protein JO357_09120 [Hyphomicrobiales bacterium]|nr:hypothetical protein [Hyphomicrobiales bacterium]MBV8768106.1 hypothetical protein [Hyphomicrobiales bacterium]MBV9053923.1 hypothetical protein [Hyphomicrobiales bacterium]MBV9137206.1 hypothetical protein [Hyphomicrobiales bacterium]MBV9590702.1 hypothetical protein [Hyphomicrobiales bacterium]
MSSDGHVATALNAFAKNIRRSSRAESRPPLLSEQQGEVRQQRLEELAAEVDGLASNPRKATYQGFESILKQVEELGAPPEREIIIAVASAFMQRPYVSEHRFHYASNGNSRESA